MDISNSISWTSSVRIAYDSAMERIPAPFAEKMAVVHGELGRQWVEDLPGLLDAFAARWDLRLGEPFSLSYNYVVAATPADGSPAVLKAGVPKREFHTELAALRHYDGRGSIRLLEADEDAGVMLLERAEPGTTLRETLTDAASDDAATKIAAGAMRDLWQPPPADHSLPSTQDWARGLERLRARFDGGTGPFDPDLVALAESLFRDLHASAATPVLLHGDLHHDNILAATRAPWLVIDPKGITGESAYEIPAFLRNPSPWLYDQPDPAATTARRVAIFADELGLDRQRIHQWNLAQAVLSAWWTFEDHARVNTRILAYADSITRLVH